MMMLHSRIAFVSTLMLFGASLAIGGCGDDTTSTTGSQSSTTAGGGGSACVPGPVAAKTIKGTVTYSGAAAMTDTLRIVAFKDGDPASGAPAGYVFSEMNMAPKFPYDYEMTITLPPENTGMFGIIAYLDVGSDSVMGPGAGDKSAPPSALVMVDDCKGAQVDLTIAP